MKGRAQAFHHFGLSRAKRGQPLVELRRVEHQRKAAAIPETGAIARNVAQVDVRAEMPLAGQDAAVEDGEDFRSGRLKFGVGKAFQKDCRVHGRPFAAPAFQRRQPGGKAFAVAGADQ